MAKVENEFSYSFPAECQEKSVPIQLQTLCSLLIDGSDPQVVGFSQASLSVAQLIMYQYRKTIPSKELSVNRRHCKERETPVAIYTGLKLYSCLRAKTVIQKLFFLGICISYERCLEICDHIVAQNLLCSLLSALQTSSIKIFYMKCSIRANLGKYHG